MTVIGNYCVICLRNSLFCFITVLKLPFSIFSLRSRMSLGVMLRFVSIGGLGIFPDFGVLEDISLFYELSLCDSSGDGMVMCMSLLGSTRSVLFLRRNSNFFWVFGFEGGGVASFRCLTSTVRIFLAVCVLLATMDLEDDELCCDPFLFSWKIFERLSVLCSLLETEKPSTEEFIREYSSSFSVLNVGNIIGLFLNFLCIFCSL